MNAFSVYDRKAARYFAPFFAVSIGEAVRSFTDLVNDPSTTVHRYPGDFVLYRVGSFDDAAGQLLVCNPAEHIADADALVRHGARAQQLDIEDAIRAQANGHDSVAQIPG